MAALGKDNNCYYFMDVSGSITYASNAPAAGACPVPATGTFSTTAW